MICLKMRQWGYRGRN